MFEAFIYTCDFILTFWWLDSLFITNGALPGIAHNTFARGSRLGLTHLSTSSFWYNTIVKITVSNLGFWRNKSFWIRLLSRQLRGKVLHIKKEALLLLPAPPPGPITTIWIVFVPGTVWSSSHSLPHLILRTTRRVGIWYYLHFAEEGAEVQRRCDLAHVSQLIRSKAWIGTQVCLTPKPLSLITITPESYCEFSYLFKKNILDVISM